MAPTATTRTPLPTKRPAPVDNDEQPMKMRLVIRNAAQRTPLPTKKPSGVVGATEENKDRQAKNLEVKHTPLPTEQAAGTTGNQERSSVNLAEGTLARRTLVPKSRSKRGDDFDEAEVDLTQVPVYAGANGVILKSGRYRCNICGNQMKNDKKCISSHNSNLHPKDPAKGSAYLRRIARNPTPCSVCSKVCSSIEMFRQHMKAAHPAPKPSTAE
ncbi:hypothetical protein GGS24DRAFT_459548 [Hypoxylon argillaceum]|nr:hypothetical protein GGS24DRAFT_459548 [Hypoxylon argillaceum]